MTLKEAIALVEKLRAEAEWAHPMPVDHWNKRDAYDAHMRAGEDLLKQLERDYGARLSGDGASGYKLRLAGVASSCTGGHWGLVRNWLAAARRKM